MARIRVKPPQPRINWRHPIARGLAFDLPLYERGGSKVVDLVNNIKLTNDNSWFLGLYGWELNTPSSGSNTITNTNDYQFLDSSTPFSLMVLLKVKSANSVQRSVFTIFKFTDHVVQDTYFEFDTANTNELKFGFNATNGSYPETTWITGFAAGSYHMVFGIWDGATNKIYADGDPNSKSSLANTVGPNVGPANIFLANNRILNVPADCEIVTAKIWSRALASSERLTLYNDPWCIYRHFPTRLGRSPSFGAYRTF